MADDSHSRHGGDHHDGPGRTSPYPVSRLAPPHDLVDVARQIQDANDMLSAVAGNKLRVIAEQVRTLHAQAKGILEGAQRDSELHQAECNFRKKPGQIYHLYRRANGRAYFSMLSPEEWGGAPPHPHEGSYRLEADMSWTPTEQIGERDQEDALVQRLLPGSHRE